MRAVRRVGSSLETLEVLDDPVIFVEPDESEAAIYHDPGVNTVMLRFKTDGFGTTEDGEAVIYDAVDPEGIWVRRGRQWVRLLDDQAGRVS